MPFPLMLHAKHDEATVTYEPMGEWVVPWRFSSTEEEYRALTSGVGLLDYSTQGLIEIRGDDRAAFLHNLLSNDIRRLAPGQGCLAALLTPSAKLITDLSVLADVNAHWILCDAIRAKRLLEELERYRFAERVELINHERAEVVLAIQGPKTLELLAELLGERPALGQRCDHLRTVLLGTQVRLVWEGLAGNIGVLCSCPAEGAQLFWGKLREAGARFGLIPVGWEALNLARIEAGVAWFGWDMDESSLLPETGLVSALASNTKGCYIGQEIIARMETYGSPSKKLMGLLIDGQRVPQTGDRLRQGDAEAGWITSACRSPALSRPIALGYVKRGAYEPGARLQLDVGGTQADATVVERPLVH